jgi:neutral ceramidase
MKSLVVCLLTLVAAAAAAEPPADASWKAGVAAVDITPQGPVWLAGFGKRTKPSESVAQPIHVKALALADGRGSRFVLVTVDLVGISKGMRRAAEAAARSDGLRPECLLLNASHTHSAPAFAASQVEEAFQTHGLPTDERWVQKANDYEKFVEGKLGEAIGQSLARLEPVRLDYGHARAGFGMNRRLPVGSEVLHEAYPDGPVDPDVPVLRVSAPDGQVKAIVFGYACHNTSVTTVVNVLTGDYAGFAQVDLEKEHPGAQAMFVQGAAGDQNPYPRGPLVYADRYGRSLADAVEAALTVKVLRPVTGPLRCALGHVELAYADTSKAELQRRSREGTDEEKAAAAMWLKVLEEKGSVPKSYPDPVQVVHFGNDLLLIAVGGEPTVGYALRLKHELAHGPEAVWFAGYSNDVFGYVGTRQVLIGGGYEGYDANLNSHPGPFALSTEERVIAKVYELIQDTNN